MTAEITSNGRQGTDATSETARRLDEMSALLHAQQAQIEYQRTQIENLSARGEKPSQPSRLNTGRRLAESDGQRSAPERPQPAASTVRVTTRRDLLKLGGAAAGAAGLAAVAGIQRPQSAQAASNPLLSAATNSTDGEIVIQTSNVYSGNLDCCCSTPLKLNSNTGR